MNIFDKSLYIVIAIFYNLFIHYLTGSLYKNLPYADRHSNSIVFLAVAGISAIVISKIYIEKNDKNKIVSKGLTIGGILLLITSLFANWENITNEYKLYLTGITFLLIIWYSYKQKEETKDKTNY